MTDKQHPAQFDWATELLDAQGHVTLSAKEAHEIGARLRSMGEIGTTMTNQQVVPDALRLVDDLESEFAQGRISNHTGRKAATELRRQHAELETLNIYKNMADEYGLSIFPDIAEMTAELETLRTGYDAALMYEELRAAIDGGNESMTHADALAEIAAIRAENTLLCHPAPQPVEREPLTPERVKKIVLDAGYDQCDIPDSERAAFINGLRHGEEAHGIKGGQQ